MQGEVSQKGSEKRKPRTVSGVTVGGRENPTSSGNMDQPGIIAGVPLQVGWLTGKLERKVCTHVRRIQVAAPQPCMP